MKSPEVWLVNVTALFRTRKLELRAPLALLYLSAALKSRGYRVRILDILEQDIEPYAKRAADTGPLFVGISSTFGVWAPLAAKFAYSLKKHSPGTPIIVGGINVSVCPEPYLKETCFDFLAIGEGETTIQEFADALVCGTGFEEIPGLAFLRDGKPFYTPPRPPEKDIDKFDIDLAGLDMNPYIETHKDGTRLLNSYQSSRGCPFNCAFCYNSAFNKRRWRSHSLAYIIKHMEFLKSKYDFSAINMIDDHFFANRKWAFKLMEKLYDMGIVLVNVDARVHDLDKEFFEKVSKLKCKSVFFGLESENPRVLDLMHKETTPEMIEKALDTALSYPEVNIIGQVILGVPTHSWPEIMDTINYMIDKVERHNNLCCNAVLYMPLPGSEFYDMAIDMGFSGYHELGDFKNIGLSTVHEYAFNMEWLDIPAAGKKRLKKSFPVATLFWQTLATRRKSRGLKWLVNELFYQLSKFRLRNMHTRFFFEAALYNILAGGYKYYQKIFRGGTKA